MHQGRYSAMQDVRIEFSNIAEGFYDVLPFLQIILI